jgi:hypothetical protein
VEPVVKVQKIMPTAKDTYGSEENKARWYALEVRQISNDAKMFTPEIVALANREFNRRNNTLGTPYFNYEFSLHSNPEDLLQYIDRAVYTVQYNEEAV